MGCTDDHDGLAMAMAESAQIWDHTSDLYCCLQLIRITLQWHRKALGTLLCLCLVVASLYCSIPIGWINPMSSVASPLWSKIMLVHASCTWAASAHSTATRAIVFFGEYTSHRAYAVHPIYTAHAIYIAHALCPSFFFPSNIYRSCHIYRTC